MLPEGFDLRKTYPGGEQARVTPAVQEISNRFLHLAYPSGFRDIHDHLFQRIKVVPYDDPIKPIERQRRWKLTADDLLKVGSVVDTKYCNDMVNLFLAVTRGVGFNSRLAKVFNRAEQGNGINVHSLALVDSPSLDSSYVINAGSRDKYWIEPIDKNISLEFGLALPNSWTLWKADVDQWAMGLNDSSQEESTIVADARKFFESRA